MQRLPRIAVIGCGGTIASISQSSLDVLDYPEFGSKLPVEDLLQGFSETRLVADPDFVIVAGDLNDTPTSAPLATLLGVPACTTSSTRSPPTVASRMCSERRRATSSHGWKRSNSDGSRLPTELTPTVPRGRLVPRARPGWHWAARCPLRENTR